MPIVSQSRPGSTSPPWGFQPTNQSSPTQFSSQNRAVQTVQVPPPPRVTQKTSCKKDPEKEPMSGLKDFIPEPKAKKSFCCSFSPLKGIARFFKYIAKMISCCGSSTSIANDDNPANNTTTVSDAATVSPSTPYGFDTPSQTPVALSPPTPVSTQTLPITRLGASPQGSYPEALNGFDTPSHTPVALSPPTPVSTEARPITRLGAPTSPSHLGSQSQLEELIRMHAECIEAEQAECNAASSSPNKQIARRSQTPFPQSSRVVNAVKTYPLKTGLGYQQAFPVNAIMEEIRYWYSENLRTNSNSTTPSNVQHNPIFNEVNTTTTPSPHNSDSGNDGEPSPRRGIRTPTPADSASNYGSDVESDGDWA